MELGKVNRVRVVAHGLSACLACTVSSLHPHTTHTRHDSTHSRQEDHKFKVMLSYIVGLRLVWAIGDFVSENKK